MRFAPLLPTNVSKLAGASSQTGCRVDHWTDKGWRMAVSAFFLPCFALLCQGLLLHWRGAEASHSPVGFVMGGTSRDGSAASF